MSSSRLMKLHQTLTLTTEVGRRPRMSIRISISFSHKSSKLDKLKNIIGTCTKHRTLEIVFFYKIGSEEVFLYFLRCSDIFLDVLTCSYMFFF